MINTVANTTLNDAFAAKKAQKTDWDTDKKTWVYVSIPAENAIGEMHEPITINGKKFASGETYFVPPAIGDEIERIKKDYARSCVRLLQPKRDYSAEQVVNRKGTNAGLVAPVDPNTLGA